MYKFIFIIILTLCFTSAYADVLGKTFTLSNGMEVLVIPNHKVPAVTHMVWYKAGAIDEPKGKTGVAHYLEHLMFKGTKTTMPGEFSSRIAEYGGYDNAMTSYDYTTYFQVIAKEHLEMVMEMEADRMENLSIDKKDAENELQVVLEERRTSIENSPYSQMTEDVKALLFPGHRYGEPVIGHRDDIEKLTLEDAMNFYHTNYTPNNAVLVVSGDVYPDEVYKMAEKHYGKISSGDVVKRNFGKPGPIIKHSITKSDEKVRKPEWVRIYRAPSIKTAKLEDVFALIVLSHILGETDTSRLYRSLVIENKIAAAVTSHYDESSLGDADFGISISPSIGADINQIEDLVEKEIKNIIDEGITEEELGRVKETIKAEALFARDGIKGMGFIAGKAVVLDIPLSYIEDWSDNVEKVTADDVRNSAQKVLDSNYSVTGLLLP